MFRNHIALMLNGVSLHFTLTPDTYGSFKHCGHSPTSLNCPLTTSPHGSLCSQWNRRQAARRYDKFSWRDKMINSKGTIYYGTSISYIEDLDKNGLSKPRERHEQFISVSISGYESPIELCHKDLEGMARVFTDVGISKILNNRLIYKTGYHNSLTYIQGFGPNPSKHLLSIYGLVENNRTNETLVAVIDKKYGNHLVEPNEENLMEHMSLAIHGFIEYIKPEFIVGWVVPDKYFEEIDVKMKSGILKKRKLWSANQIEEILFDDQKSYKYPIYPDKISLYLKNIEKNNYYHETKLKHLKHILKDVIKDGNWMLNGLESRLTEWLKMNQGKITWDDPPMLG